MVRRNSIIRDKYPRGYSNSNKKGVKEVKVVEWHEISGSGTWRRKWFESDKSIL